MLVKSSMTGDYFINSCLDIVHIERRCEDVFGYYAILGVDVSATQEEIKRAAKKKIMENHPDVGGANEKFLEILEAYKTLSNPSQRAVYDSKIQSQDYILVSVGPVEEKPPCFYKEAMDIISDEDIKKVRKWQNILLEIAHRLKVSLEIKVGITSQPERVQERKDIFVVDRNNEPKEYMAKVFVLRSLTWQI